MSEKPPKEMINKFQANILVMNISTTAYAKIVLHAYRHPTSHVGGYIIGLKSTMAVTISDIIPIHHELPVGPILEAAAETIEGQLKQPNKIIGYYYGHDNTNAIDLGKQPAYILGLKETITANSGFCVLLEINDKLLSSKDTLCLQTTGIYTIGPDEGSLKTLQVVDALLEQGFQYRVADFEDYLNSSGACPADYLNTFLHPEVTATQIRLR